MDQTALFDCIVPAKLANELSAYDSVKQKFEIIVDDWYLPIEDLTVEPNKGSNLLIVKLCGSVVCRYKMNGKKWHIEIPKQCEKDVPDGLKPGVRHPKGDYIFVDINANIDMSILNDCLVAALEQTIASIPKDFSCCSRYEACSNAGKCIHPDREIAKGCYYKRVMHSGRIFYGINKSN